MTVKSKKERPNGIKWWITTIGIFLIVQLTFFIIDGTSLEPRLNDSDNIMRRYADWLKESKIFNEWITLYSFPWFNLATTLFVIFLLANIVADIFLIRRINQNRS